MQSGSRHIILPLSGAAASIGTSYFLGRSTNVPANQVSCRMIKSMKYHWANNASANMNQKVQNRYFSAKSAPSSGGFVQWYEGHLQARPVLTKATTGSILWGLGDVVAQVVPSLIFSEEKKNESSDEKMELDIARTGRAVFYGFVIHAPLSHMHYNFLEWMTIRGGFVGNSIPVFKTVMEQFVYWSWFSNSLYHGAMGAMQGMSFDQIYNRISDVLWDTQKAQWAFWIPVQLLNFKFVPVRHQLNVVLMTSVAWTALLSAWYPPENVEAESKAVTGDEEVS